MIQHFVDEDPPNMTAEQGKARRLAELEKHRLTLQRDLDALPQDDDHYQLRVQHEHWLRDLARAVADVEAGGDGKV